MAEAVTTSFYDSVDQLEKDAGIIHNVINGDSTTTIPVEDGSLIPSLRKAIVDNLYFQTPILPWTQGQATQTFNQLYSFQDATGITSWWYAPGASASRPALMGATPVSDINWKVVVDSTTISGIYATIASPTFTGSPRTPTPEPGDNSTLMASTAFVTAALTNAFMGSVAATFSSLEVTGQTDLKGETTILGTVHADTASMLLNTLRLMGESGKLDFEYTTEGFEEKLKTIVSPNTIQTSALTVDTLKVNDKTVVKDLEVTGEVTGITVGGDVDGKAISPESVATSAGVSVGTDLSVTGNTTLSGIVEILTDKIRLSDGKEVDLQNIGGPSYLNTATDLNNEVANDHFAWSGTTLNTPAEGSFGRGLTIASDGDNLSQIAVISDTRFLWVRFRSSGTWTAWQSTLASSTESKAADRADIAGTPAGVREFMEQYGITATYTSTSTNLDNEVRGQFFNYGASTANSPVSGSYGRGVAIPSGGGYVTQLAVENDSGLLYVRYNTAGTWSAWIKTGEDGDSVDLQKTDTYIQWKHTSSSTWNNLIAIADLKGNPGEAGTGLTNRQNWVSGTTYNPGDYVFAAGTTAESSMWIYSGTEAFVSTVEPKSDTSHWTEFEAPAGQDGKSVELQKTTTAIQWRQTGGAWADLVLLSDLKGTDGTNGTNGVDGRPVELQKGTTHIQWRYTGDTTWTDLVAIADISGDDYVLPNASATVLGGVKVGNGLTINEAGVLSTSGTGGISTAQVFTALTTDLYIGAPTDTDTYTLASTEVAVAVWHLTGYLNNSITLVIPNGNKGRWLVDAHQLGTGSPLNQVIIKTDSTASQIVSCQVAPGTQMAIYCDGSSVYLENSGGGSGGSSGGAIKAVTTADQGTTDTSFADVTDMSFDVVGGQSYYTRMAILFQTGSIAAGIKFQLVGTPSIRSMGLMVRSMVGADGTGNQFSGLINSYSDPVVVYGSSEKETKQLAIIEGVIIPSSSGTIKLQFATSLLYNYIAIQQGSVAILDTGV